MSEAEKRIPQHLINISDKKKLREHTRRKNNIEQERERKSFFFFIIITSIKQNKDIAILNCSNYFHYIK